jgi:DNA-binding FadR family transcriptional regulator
MPSDTKDQNNTEGARERRPVRYRRMHEDLVELLADDIRQGIYAVGNPLPSERQLMEEFSVSRATVRDAMAALENYGLIETHPGTRARVCGPRADFLIKMLSQAAAFYLHQPDGLRTFGEVRVLVETGVVRLAAENISDAQIEVLRKKLDWNQRAIGDTQLFGKTDIDFHLAIAEIVNNPIISSFFRAVEQWLQDVRDISLRNAGQMEIAYAAHAKIFEAIEARSPDLAATQMRDHLHQLLSIYPRNPEAESPL